MIKKISVALAVASIALFAYAAVQPAEYVISRELVIDASPEEIFPRLNSSRQMMAWMPWAEQDKQMVMSYSGPDEGVGAVSKWESKGEMGTGSSTISESIANQKVVSQLEYLTPFAMTQVSELSLSSKSDGTLVRWSVNGKNGLIGRIFVLFLNMDKKVGASFEKGLQNLKSLAESNR